MSVQIPQIASTKFTASSAGFLPGITGSDSITGAGLTGPAASGNPFDLLLAMTLSLGEVGKALESSGGSQSISQPDLFQRDSTPESLLEFQNAIAAGFESDGESSSLRLFSNPDEVNPHGLAFDPAKQVRKLNGPQIFSLFAHQKLSPEAEALLEQQGIELPGQHGQNASLTSVLRHSVVTANPAMNQDVEVEATPQPVDDDLALEQPDVDPLLWAAAAQSSTQATTPRESLGLVVANPSQWQAPSEFLSQKSKSETASLLGRSNAKSPLASTQSGDSSFHRVWNIQELTQHLEDVMRSRVQESQLAQLGEAAPQGDAPEFFSTASAPLDATASSAGADTAYQVIADTLEAAAVDAPLRDSDDPAAGAEVEVEAVRPQVHQWQARPIASGPEAGRMPDMIAQVREISEFLAERTEGTIRLGERTVEANLRLFPPDLGGVRVEIQVSQNNTVQAQFIADHPETAQLIEKHVSQLQEALGRHGLTVERVQVGIAPSASGAGSSDTMQGQFRREAEGQAREQAQQRRENSRQSGNPESNRQDR